LLEADHAVETLAVATVNEADLARVHTEDFIAAVKRASSEPGYFDLSFGIGTTDVPRFDGMHDATLMVCAATITAVQALRANTSMPSTLRVASIMRCPTRPLAFAFTTM
jgi:acetoin utilization protein AcuC